MGPGAGDDQNLADVAGHSTSRTILVCLSTAAALGVLSIWTARPQMSPDGVSYLDLADAFLRRDWGRAFNTLWSPLYPMTLALAFRIFRPAPSWEFTEVTLVNLVIYLAALASFSVLLREVHENHGRLAAGWAPGDQPQRDWAFPVIGYALVAFSSLQLIHLADTTPDLLMSVFVYLSAALLVKIVRHPFRLWTFPLLGASLGAGYWAKAPMFPLALVFLMAAAFSAYSSMRLKAASLRLLTAAAAFTIVTGALALAYRETRGHLTLGDSARLNYAWLINGLPYAHWQGRPPGFGSPVHPTRRVLDHPPVYEFAFPVRGTYPPWLDPAYWYEGVRPRFDPGAHIRAAARNMRFVFFEILLGKQSALLTAALALAFLVGSGRQLFAHLRARSMLLFPGVAAVAMFSLIRIEARFVAAFLVLVWLAVFDALTASVPAQLRRAGQVILVAAAIGLMLPALASLVVGVVRTANPLGRRHEAWRIAQDLHRAGVKSGDRIAVIGWGLGAYWARLAGVTIVAEICAERPSRPWLCDGGPDGIREFWALSPVSRQRVYAAFRRAGATAVVATSLRDSELVVVDAVPTDSWRALASPGYFVRTLGGAALRGGSP